MGEDLFDEEGAVLVHAFFQNHLKHVDGFIPSNGFDAVVISQKNRGDSMKKLLTIAFLCLSLFAFARDVFLETLKLAEQGDADAQYTIGLQYRSGKMGVPQRNKEAMKWFLKAAEQGNPKAQNTLGEMYGYGFRGGVSQDEKEALKWYLKSAEQGNAKAQCSLGGMFADGKGVPKDYGEAVKWYLKAAENGDAIALFNIGIMLEEGQVVPKNNLQAYFWFCCVKGDLIYNDMAADHKNRLEMEMTPSQIEEGQRLARIWLAKHPQ